MKNANNSTGTILLKNILMGLFILTISGNIFAQASFTQSANDLDANAKVDAKICEMNGSVYFLIMVENQKADSYIIVERSVDGLNFESVGYVKCLGNNATFPVSYSFVDKNPMGINSYYRLVSFDTYKNAYTGDVLAFSTKDEYFESIRSTTEEPHFEMNNSIFLTVKD